jgi:hypothetical protein
VLGFLCGGENWTRAKCEEAVRAPPAGGGARPPTRVVTACREVAP